MLITQPEQIAAFDSSGLDRAGRWEDLARHQPDTHWLWLDRDGKPAARCSLWWRQTPFCSGHRLGLIGHYAAADLAAGQSILTHAHRELARHGSTLALGPMDENTWRRYRLVTEPGNRPPFFLEPEHPPNWPEHWAAAGFTPFAQYHSRVTTDLEYEDRRGQQAGERLQALGVRFRNLVLEDWEEELKRLYPLIVAGFERALLYSPISREAFVAQYRPLQPRLIPELIRIAEHNGKPVGLLFGVPDFLQSARGEPVRTAIIKTLVIAADRAYAGLGSFLTAQFHRRCHCLGFKEVIHALMHSSSKSQNISVRYGAVMRRYALFSKTL